MNTNKLYNIYETNREHSFHDLIIGLAQFKSDHPGTVSQEEDKAIRQIIGAHGPELAKAFPDREKFAAAVAEGMAEDAKKAAEAK